MKIRVLLLPVVGTPTFVEVPHNDWMAWYPLLGERVDTFEVYGVRTSDQFRFDVLVDGDAGIRDTPPPYNPRLPRFMGDAIVAARTYGAASHYRAFTDEEVASLRERFGEIGGAP
jgi:hypothetical protein